MKEDPHAESSKNPFQENKKEGKRVQEGKGLVENTSLTMSRDKILVEITFADMKEERIKYTQVVAPKVGANKSKYCRFHKYHGHTTDECIHLNDTIKILIQRGKLRQFTKNASP